MIDLIPKRKISKMKLPIKSLLSVFFVLAGVSVFFAQSQSSPAQKVESSAIKSDGWTLPNLSNSRVVFEGTKVLNNAVVKLLIQNLNSPQEMKLQFFLRSPTGSLEILEQETEVSTVTSYELGGRIFAYKVDYVPFERYEDIKVRLGKVYPYFYVDNDGDGVFEERRSSSSPFKIPSREKIRPSF